MSRTSTRFPADHPVTWLCAVSADGIGRHGPPHRACACAPVAVTPLPGAPTREELAGAAAAAAEDEAANSGDAGMAMETGRTGTGGGGGGGNGQDGGLRGEGEERRVVEQTHVASQMTNSKAQKQQQPQASAPRYGVNALLNSLGGRGLQGGDGQGTHPRNRVWMTLYFLPPPRRLAGPGSLHRTLTLKHPPRH
ncbi:MAG: hypothetical protein WDW38_011537 [Sanguina aurantia]